MFGFRLYTGILTPPGFTTSYICILDIANFVTVKAFVIYLSLPTNYKKAKCAFNDKCLRLIFMPPFEEVGVYCFANASLSVGPSVGPLVRRHTLSDH